MIAVPLNRTSGRPARSRARLPAGLLPVRGDDDGRSLTEQAHEALLAGIHADAFPDDRLPPEAELAGRLGVSRPTLRAALAALEADGLITRRRRWGTTVNRRVLRTTMRLNRLVPFTALIAQQGRDASAVHVLGRGPAGDLGSLLGVPEDADCVLVDRLLSADGVPVATLRDLVPVAALTVAPEDVVAGDSTFAFVAASCARPVDYATTDVVPGIATAGDPAGLLVAPGAPYLELRETHVARDHEVLAVTRARVDTARMPLSFVRRRA